MSRIEKFKTVKKIAIQSKKYFGMQLPEIFCEIDTFVSFWDKTSADKCLEKIKALDFVKEVETEYIPNQPPTLKVYFS